MDSQACNVIESINLLGITITNNLTWNTHLNNAVKKAANCLYFLKQPKHANAHKAELVKPMLLS